MLTSRVSPVLLLFFFFNDTATTKIYTLSLHDALPISSAVREDFDPQYAIQIAFHDIQVSLSCIQRQAVCKVKWTGRKDRKSTRLNSSHLGISYAVFCLKKKKKYMPR